MTQLHRWVLAILVRTPKTSPEQPTAVKSLTQATPSISSLLNPLSTLAVALEPLDEITRHQHADDDLLSPPVVVAIVEA